MKHTFTQIPLHTSPHATWAPGATHSPFCGAARPGRAAVACAWQSHTAATANRFAATAMQRQRQRHRHRASTALRTCLAASTRSPSPDCPCRIREQFLFLLLLRLPFHHAVQLALVELALGFIQLLCQCVVDSLKCAPRVIQLRLELTTKTKMDPVKDVSKCTQPPEFEFLLLLSSVRILRGMYY